MTANHCDWCTDTLCIALLCMWFKNRTDEHVTLSNSGKSSNRSIIQEKQRKIFVAQKVKIAVMKWFKKFCLNCKKLNNKVTSGRPKTKDFEIVLQVIEANLASSTWQSIRWAQYPTFQCGSSCSWFWQKASGAAKLCLVLLKYCKTFDST